MRVVAIVSDLHTNSTVGLCPPVVQLDDGGTYRASKPQLWLWQNWLKYWQIVREKADNKPLVVVINGDLTDGDHHNTHQIISRNRADMVKIGISVLEPVLRVNDTLYVVRGTPSHAGKGGELDEQIAKDLGAIGPEKGRHSWYRLLLQVNNTKFDISHHTGGGMLPWTRANHANKIAIQAMVEEGRDVADVVIRSHRHRYADSGHNYKTLGVITPAWQLNTEYVYKLGIYELSDIGGLLFFCPTKEAFTWEPIMFQPKKQPFIQAI